MMLLIANDNSIFFSMLCVCVFGFKQFQQFFSHITTVSGCDRELNAHFYSAASLKYHVPDTWHDTTPSHIILTLGRPVLALYPVSLSAKRGAASTIFNDFGMSRAGIETVTSRSLERTLYVLSYRGRCFQYTRDFIILVNYTSF